jgi:hypothetical protein
MINYSKNIRFKTVISLITLLLTILSGTVLCSAASNSSVTVIIDGEVMDFDAEPEIVNNITFVPMRGIFEALGLDVNWDDSRKEVSSYIDSDNDPVSNGEIILKIGSKTAICGTHINTLPVAPYIKNNRTMLPLRFLSEAVDCDVQWDSTTRTVTVTSNTQDDETEPDDTDTSDTSDDGILSYDSAIENAIKNSSSVESAQITYKQANRTLTEFQWLYSHSDEFTVWQNRKDLTIYRNWAEKNIALTEEQTAYTAVSYMDQISLKIMQTARKEDNVNYLKSVMDTAELKLNLGSASRKDYLSAKSDYDSAVKELETLKLELSGLYTTLNSVVQMDNITDLTPEFLLQYESVSDYDMNEFIKEEMANDPYIWYAEQNLDSAEFKLETYEYNLAGGKSYTLTALDMQTAKNNLSGTKQKYDSVLRSRYNSLLQIEDNISTLELNLDTLKENIDTLRTMYDAEMSTNDSLKSLLQSKADLEMNIRSLKVQHSLTKMLLDKPYLAPEYMSS